MIIRNLEAALSQGRCIEDPNGNWQSTRLLLSNDGMGFSFHITTIHAGADFQMHYQNHLEAVYCISGRGEVIEIETSKVHPITPGTVYALDQHDKHRLIAHQELVLACVFNPPLNGQEVHNAQGAYELNAPLLDN